MQGLFLDDKRPASKKAVREAVADCPDRVRLEATSMFGGEYDGLRTFAPAGAYYAVGPDPRTSRKFYIEIIVREGKIQVK